MLLNLRSSIDACDSRKLLIFNEYTSLFAQVMMITIIYAGVYLRCQRTCICEVLTLMIASRLEALLTVLVMLSVRTAPDDVAAFYDFAFAVLQYLLRLSTDYEAKIT